MDVHSGPTKKQLSQWETDGGNQTLIDENVELINGEIFIGPFAKAKKILLNAWHKLFPPSADQNTMASTRNPKKNY